MHAQSQFKIRTFHFLRVLKFILFITCIVTQYLIIFKLVSKLQFKVVYIFALY